MTRPIVYNTALVVVAAVTAMTCAAIFRPTWVSFHVDVPPQSTSALISRSLGLHQSCTTDSHQTICRPFPSQSDCAKDVSFCSMWRTVGFLMSLAMLVELVSLVLIAMALLGGKAQREAGWRVLAGFLGLVGFELLSATAFVAYLFDHHSRFAIPGWRLDTSWVLCTVSGAVAVLSAVGVAISAYVLPPEDGYELLLDRPGV